MPSERRIQDYAIKQIEALRGEGFKVEVRNRAGSPFQQAGDPDVYGSIDGRHFELECKRSAKLDPTSLQNFQLASWKAAGAIVGVGRTREEIDKFVAKLRSQS